MVRKSFIVAGVVKATESEDKQSMELQIGEEVACLTKEAWYALCYLQYIIEFKKETQDNE